MNRTHARGPVEPPFSCTSLRLVAEPVEAIVSRLASVVENDNREPRYRAEGREIVTVHTGRRQSPPKAREALFFMVEGILATNQDDLVDSDILRMADLVRAIRAAERNDPTPPANIARAA
ncbi:hypothetical protein [Brevundimonas sp.]|uniref:hypothetical protein n=1 Tax=Brevundimonas sp. TaxID=1871086 RepID=UPI002D2C5D0E|nr:hypothetical protein [Brevundimonas sp.]HYC66678.1 hypothetical protein [Brevundimonas sp.]